MKLKLLAAATLVLLGLGSAVALADIGSTGTVSVCATAMAPSHTVAVDGSDVATVGGDTNSQCATTTYTVPTVTQTVTATVAGTTTDPTTTTTSPPPPSASGAGIGVLNYGHLSTFSNIGQYDFVIGSSWSGSEAAVLENASGKGLTYFDGTDVATTYSTGVPYTQASANGWLLKNSAGSLMVNSTYGTYCADVGSATYQQAWISNVLAYLAGHPGEDGVFIDNVMYDPKAECGGYPAKYPTTASYAAATVSFMKAVYAALHAKGYYVAINAGSYIPNDPAWDDGTSMIAWWKQVGPYADALMDEFYDETASSTGQMRALGSAWYQHWDGWQRLIGTAQGMGDAFLGLTKQTCTDTAAMTYGKASFLLEWNGGPSSFLYTCGATDPANPAWTTNIGQPAGAKVAVGVGWERSYTKGTVLVNPSATSSQTFTVNGTSYTLSPTTARILG